MKKKAPLNLRSFKTDIGDHPARLYFLRAKLPTHDVNAIRQFTAVTAADEKRVIVLNTDRDAQHRIRPSAEELRAAVAAAAPTAVILRGDRTKSYIRKLGKAHPIFLAPIIEDVWALLHSFVDNATAILFCGQDPEIAKLRRKKSIPAIKSQVRDQRADIAFSLETARKFIPDPRSPANVNGNFNIGLYGDTYFGEIYSIRDKIDVSDGNSHHSIYEEWIPRFRKILSSNQVNIANLETSITTLKDIPFPDKYRSHRAPPKPTLPILRQAGINVMTLGNNHSFDFGEMGVRDSINHVVSNDIVPIGLGLDEVDAARPLWISPNGMSPDAAAETYQEILVFAGLVWRSSVERRFFAYARDERAGCNPVDQHLIDDVARAREMMPNAFILIVPHWQGDYKFASRRQRIFARDVLEAGADLVVGHGAHMLQQVERFGGKLAVHGIGNFIFRAPGRYESFAAPPISASAQVILERNGASPNHRLRLYPLLTDNKQTNYKTRPLRPTEMKAHIGQYYKLGFLPADMQIGDDEGWPFLEFAVKTG